VRPHTQVIALLGEDQLDGVELAESVNRQASRLAVAALFIFIGAKPCTQWLDGQLAQDDDGFLLTGTDIPPSARGHSAPTPLLLETSRPGIFSVGDVRSGSVKRVATAIGEGSMAVRLVFERLQATGIAVADPPHVAR
jgi:thioredoxin reductase (NADPH)